MATPYELSASRRDGTGKGAARAARRAGMIPAVIYGGGEAPESVAVAFRDIDLKLQKGGFLTTIATLNFGDSKIRVIPREFQLDPVRDHPIHVDFLRVTADSRLTLGIPVRFINELAAPGIKRGGVLNIVRHTIEVTVPADAIPEAIIVDLTGLNINDSIHISAVQLPEGVRPTIQGRDFTIASIAAPAGLKDEAANAAEAAAATVASAASTAAADAKKPAEAKPLAKK